jgi:hypothetical protein
MGCALCTSNAPRLVAFPLRLTGSCLLTRNLSVKYTFFFVTTAFELSTKSKCRRRPGFRPLLLAYLAKIDVADYLHSGGGSIIGCRDFLKSFYDTSTLELPQRLDPNWRLQALEDEDLKPLWDLLGRLE